MEQRRFLIASVVTIVVVRLGVIIATPHSTQLDDLRIYQGTGRVVLAGLNPYDFNTATEQREALRRSMAPASHGSDLFTDTTERWNYYVSGNLPASTAMYAAFEWISHGNGFVWRLLFIAGDVGIFLGLCSVVRTVRGTTSDKRDQLGIFALSVLNPVLLVSGCAIPEDKQFQTALMLFCASSLLGQSQRKAVFQGLGSGLLLSLSILFKAFGIFLVPLWLRRSASAGLSYFLGSVAGGALPALLALFGFGIAFFATVGARAASDSFTGPIHASPWVLLTGLAPGGYLLAKSMVVLALGALLAVRWRQQQLDILNFCAGACLVFVTLWLDRGAMNRMNIAIVFATAGLASVAPQAWYRLALGSAAVSALAYLCGYALLHWHLESIDAVLTTVFLVAYFALITALPRMRRNGALSSRVPA
jgi:hypothetical protein